MICFRRIAAGLFALSLAACGSGGGASSEPPAPTPTQTPAGLQTVPTQFTFYVPQASASVRKPAYVGAGVKSVTIALDSVNGSPPSGGLTTSVTSNITPPCTPCTVNGPSVPPGSDGFTVTTYDALNGSGNIISVASPTLTITVGQANSNSITLLGVPASFSITGLPAGTAGTAFASPKSFTVTVKDADGNAITGQYANAVTISDSDTASLALATALAVNGGTAASSVQSTGSSDKFTLNYGGLAISPVTITASASGARSGTATFAPVLSPIVYTGPTSGANPEIDLYAPSGAGSSATFTATENGWTNAPYNKSITSTESSACSSIATTAATSSTGFTTAAAASPAAGTCTMTLSDFTGGNSKDVTITYTTAGFGVN